MNVAALVQGDESRHRGVPLGKGWKPVPCNPDVNP